MTTNYKMQHRAVNLGICLMAMYGLNLVFGYTGLIWEAMYWLAVGSIITMVLDYRMDTLQEELNRARTKLIIGKVEAAMNIVNKVGGNPHDSN